MTDKYTIEDAHIEILRLNQHIKELNHVLNHKSDLIISLRKCIGLYANYLLDESDRIIFNYKEREGSGK